jgi:hypothetical protein
MPVNQFAKRLWRLFSRKKVQKSLHMPCFDGKIFSFPESRNREILVGLPYHRFPTGYKILSGGGVLRPKNIYFVLYHWRLNHITCTNMEDEKKKFIKKV